jgi:hypothetical protein
MGQEDAKRAAEEYLATRLSEETLRSEERLNREAAVALGPTVWRRLAETIFTQCREWNRVTGEETLSCKETALGDLRIWCAGRHCQMLVHYNSRRGLVSIKNTARPENEPDTVLSIEGFASGEGRDARLVRTNSEPVNVEMLVLGHLRVLAGLSRRAE